MKEGLILLLALITAYFLASVIHQNDQSEYYLIKGELRAHQLYTELETFEPRALIYARSKIDDFLASANGTACILDPLDPRPEEFLEVMSDDLGYKAFLGSIDLDFRIFETNGEEVSNGVFGSYCRKGGIGVDVSGSVYLEDGLTGIRGARRIGSIGCQQTAYFEMKRLLERLDSEVRSAVWRASRELPNTTNFFKELNIYLKENLNQLRETHNEFEIKISYISKTYSKDEDLKVYLHFFIVVKDVKGVFILNGDEHEGFWCMRELILVAGPQ